MTMRNPHDPKAELWNAAMNFMQDANRDPSNKFAKENAEQCLEQYFTVLYKGIKLVKS
jgi:hypothetical protein